MPNDTVVPFRRCANPKQYIVMTVLPELELDHVVLGLREGRDDNPVEIFVAIPKSILSDIKCRTWIHTDINYGETIKMTYTEKQIPVLKRFEVVRECPTQKLREILKL